ncbi:Flagellar P-ring protein precursor FlgI [Candidatus Cyrtobacter comes]|uniref:Flagellar P-ring protein n=1 Tax=Candidatus Cyrtobacter comes TaxID=675776 RepID=A0ABU5L867_9RICK|nr:flagellar basal body P-ring protein FlgI [Candidatus Cyrtobacter comes]MDZ5762318.1 Flagellar P-ring protein precursor FlgI [Candidatus Cyrtobacter comes]
MALCFPLNVVFGVPARLKDIVFFESIRENALLGYGIVVGLEGTGDNPNNAVFTQKMIVDFLEKLGLNTKGDKIRSRNIAAVAVTGSLPSFARSGNKLYINVSTIGDARSLKGGILTATPLFGADGNIYALAQGPVNIGTATDPNHSKTSGYITEGAIVEKEIEFSLNDINEIKLALRNPDIGTARSIAAAINMQMRGKFASAYDPGTVKVDIPLAYKMENNVMDFLSDIENLTVEPNMTAKVIIDEGTGTVIIGESVKIGKVAISHANMVIRVGDNDLLSSILSANKEEENEPGVGFSMLNESADLSDLVNNLNLLKVKVHDLITILIGIQKAGALHGSLEIRR